MASKFGFYSDPALTTAIRGAVVMTVKQPGLAVCTVYFGSPKIGDECFAADGGQIIISSSNPDVSVALYGQGSAQTVDIGASVQGGVAAAKRIEISSAGPSSDVVVSSNQLVEWMEVVNG